MKTKILYVLTSSETDIYLEQAYVSICSVRHHMPYAHITVVTDSVTKATLTGLRADMLKDVNELVVVDLPSDMSGQKRSRELKTSCRNHVKGDFLFIDCDTLVCRPLDEIDDIPYDLAACRDGHSDLADSPYRDMCLLNSRKIGDEISDESIYFNSGVILARDVPMVHEFYDRWHANLNEGRSHGVMMDQPSFCKTNIQMGHVIKLLPDVWNCQIIHGIRYLPEARVLHYLTTNAKSVGHQAFILKEKESFDKLKTEITLPESITECFDNPFKGIPECVMVSAGNIAPIIHSKEIAYFLRPHNKVVSKFWNFTFRVLNKLHRTFGK